MALSFCIELARPEQDRLLEIARQSIASGLVSGAPMQLDTKNLASIFSGKPGVFVTLTRFEQLQGCVGSLETSQPLAQSVAVSAFNAAFRDSRFPKLVTTDLDDTCIEISILSELEPLLAADRVDLLQRLRPREDGLLLEDGRFHATFLPRVWETISDPEEFLDHLLVKAGLSADYWSESIRFKRYQALSFSD